MIETLRTLALAAGHSDMPIPETRNLADARPGTWLYEALTLGTPTYTGRSINPTTAMSYTAVYSCVSMIAQDLAACDLVTNRSSDDWRSFSPATNDYRFRLLREQPNPEMSSFQWREQMIVSLLTWGNSYSYIDWDERGRIKAIWPLRPEWVLVIRNQAQRLEYRYNPLYPYSIPVPAGTYSDWQILHIPFLGFDGAIGYSPLAMARQAVGLGLAAEEYAGRFYANNARPNLALTTTVGVKDPEALKKAWYEAYGGLENSGRVAVLPPGMDVKTFSIPFRDAQFLEGRAWQTGEIARLYKVPPYLIGDPSGKTSTYASAEQGDIVYGKHCLTPIARRIEQKLDMTVLGSQDALTCRHDLADIMRGDVVSQAEADASDVLNGIKTRDECRSKRGLNPFGGNAATLMVQMQTVPIEDAGKFPAPGANQ